MVSEALMQSVMEALDGSLNGDKKGADRKVGIVLLTFPLGADNDQRVSYACNGGREVAYVAVKEALARLEGRYFEHSATQ